jgi:hypothetical protein
VTFTISDGAATFGDVAGCTTAPPGTTVTCGAPADDMVVKLVLLAPSDVSTPVTITVAAPGVIETKSGDETRRVTLLPAPVVQDVDVSLGNLTPAVARPMVNDRYELTGALDIRGPAAARVETITYSIANGSFVAEGGTVKTLTRSASERKPGFVVTRPGAGSVEISAEAVGFHETAAVDNVATATLKPYDISVTELSPDTATAGKDDAQSFTATIDRDGFTEPISASVVDTPVGATASIPVVRDNKVTFTVTSTTSGRVTLGIVLPDGFTDADPSHNEKSTTFTPKPVEPFSFDGAPSATRTSPNDYDVEAKVANIPAGVTKLVLTMSNSQQRFNSAVGPCNVTGDREVTCTVPSGVDRFTAKFNAKLPGKSPDERNPLTVNAGDKTITTQITFGE